MSFALISLSPQSAFAHEPPATSVRIKAAIQGAQTVFEKEETGATIKAAIGTKAWLGKESLFVKIYLSEKRELVYVCKEHDEHDAHGGSAYHVECSKQSS